jgi:hypothetical protein
MVFAILSVQHFFYFDKDMQMMLKTHTTNKFLMNLLAVSFIAGISTHVMADNKAAYKDAIAKDAVIDKVAGDDKTPADVKKMAEAKPTEATGNVSSEADFKKLDGNNDQKISLKEAVKDKGLAAQFDATDANHDGLLSIDEFTIYKSSLASKAMDGLPSATPTN